MRRFRPVDNNEKLAYMEHFLVIAFYSILAFVVGLFSWSFLPSYMREKGKNLATKEDIQELARQTEILTQTTKEIEARISISVWSKEQRWDIQKTALLDSLKELATAETFLVRLVQTFVDTKDHPQGWEPRRKEANEKYAERINNFWRTQLAIEIVCGREIGSHFQEVDTIFDRVRKSLKQGEFDDIWNTHYPELLVAKRQLGETVRRRLGLDVETGGELVPGLGITLQSSEPSAVPSRDLQGRAIGTR
jgi:hypothetical protein